MNDCVFCKIGRREMDADALYEDDDIIAFRDIHPKAPVHILLVPKRHIESIARLEADHTGIIAKLIYAAKHVAAAKGLGGYKLVFNVGREGGQVIDHLHLHLLGGWERPEDWKKGFSL